MHNEADGETGMNVHSRASRSFVAPAGLVLSILLGIGAQVALNAELPTLGILGYLAAVGCAVVAVPPLYRGAGASPADQSDEPVQPARRLPFDWRLPLGIASLATAAATFALSGGNRYRLEGVLLWLISIGLWWAAWADLGDPARWRTRLRAALQPTLVIGALVGVLALGAAFRFVNLGINPLEMGSDHAEKLLDVHDVLNGEPYIFFERNTGREPWQFYWTVALVKLFNLPADFMALKLGTSLIGWLMLPAVFLLAREVFGSRIALVATLFAAVASWAVIPARFGLRYPLAPCATAWTMYFLVRGLRRNERNALLAAGLAMGIGLQGYTAYRFMPVVVGLLVGLWAGWQLLRRRYAVAYATAFNGGLAVGMAVLVLMPLLRYGYDRPERLLYRATTRLTGQEQAIQGDVAMIFLDNLRRVLLFFNYTYDVVPVVNIPFTHPLDLVLGALLVIGAAATLALSLKACDPWPALILGAGVLMLFPSALSIAFPGENPSTVRTGGAVPMLMIVCAVVPGMLLELVRHARPLLVRGALAMVLVGVTALVIGLNIDRVFNRYPAQYCGVGVNASDIARELEAFVAEGNPRANTWIVGYPHWVDYRAVAIWIGDITYDNQVVGLEQLAEVDLNGQPGWFALHLYDVEGLQLLRTTYPQGESYQVEGRYCPEQRFVVFRTE